MKLSALYRRFAIFFIGCIAAFNSYAFDHEIIFCGERIPVENNFVAEKLMNIISRQIPNVKMAELRKRVKANFPIVEYYLRKTNLPQDLKYIAIVESGFLQNATSRVGAQGFWQLMPNTATDRGLIVSPYLDERNDIYKSTYAACKHLAANYKQIKKRYNVSSWVLTAAAYNYGIGNMFDKIDNQGKDYFTMKLNEETAAYVYKIIAVKELFEYPELYLDDFGFNVFNTIQQKAKELLKKTIDTSGFNRLEVKLNKADQQRPDSINLEEPPIPGQEIFTESNGTSSSGNFDHIFAVIKGNYKDFKDGNLVAIELKENLRVRGSFYRKGNQFQGHGWIIDDRIYINLGFDEHYVTLLDVKGQKGIEPADLKNKQPILLKVQKM